MNCKLYSIISSLCLIWSCAPKTVISSQNNTFEKVKRDTINQGSINTIMTFPKTLNENSGIQAIGNDLWTFNDSGGKNILYKVNIHGEILQEVTLKNATNIDWEDISSDDNFLYVGDFGNNNGNRKDLTIYKIPKSKITTAKHQQLTADIITFEYSKRNDFSKRPYQHDFDCESMFIYEDKIHLLTKAWKTGVGSHYTLPTSKGNHSALFVEEFDTQGFLTAADITSNRISAVQYTRDGQVVLWDFTMNNNGYLFENPIHATYLGNTSKLGQIEGLMFLNNKLYISGEEMDGISPTLYQIER